MVEQIDAALLPEQSRHDFIREAIAHHLKCPLASPEIVAVLDVIAQSMGISRSELVERCGSGILKVVPGEQEGFYVTVVEVAREGGD